MTPCPKRSNRPSGGYHISTPLVPTKPVTQKAKKIFERTKSIAVMKRDLFIAIWHYIRPWQQAPYGLVSPVVLLVFFVVGKKNWLAVKEDGLHNSLIAANGDFWGKLLDFANEDKSDMKGLGEGSGYMSLGFLRWYPSDKEAKSLEPRLYSASFHDFLVHQNSVLPDSDNSTCLRPLQLLFWNHGAETTLFEQWNVMLWSNMVAFIVNVLSVPLAALGTGWSWCHDLSSWMEETWP